MATKKYLDNVGLQDVASHVNSRLKTVTEMPLTANLGATRLYTGNDTLTYKKGHIYQMTATEQNLLQFSAETTTYFMAEDGTITSTAPTSYTPSVENVPFTDDETGKYLMYSAGNNRLIQRTPDDTEIINNVVTVNFTKIKNNVNPWWTEGSATGSYDDRAIRNVQLVAITAWVDITSSAGIKTVTEMPSQPDDGEVVIYLGEDGTYTKNHLYQAEYASFYGWRYAHSYVFTKSATPSVGDNTYYQDNSGKYILSDDTVTSVGEGTITVNTTEYSRYDSSDANVILWNDITATVTVDQTFDGESTNPQSGTAVAEAVENKLDKKSTIPVDPDEVPFMYVGADDGYFKEGHVYQYSKTPVIVLAATELSEEVLNAHLDIFDYSGEVGVLETWTVKSGLQIFAKINDGTKGLLSKIEFNSGTTWIVYNPSETALTSGDTVELSKDTGWLDLSDFQNRELSTPITVDGVQETTVEGALGAINQAIENIPAVITPKGSVAFDNLPSIQGTFAQVTPAGTENPSEEGWYEKSNGHYSLSADEEVDSEKTYYEKTGDTTVQLGWMYNISTAFTTNEDFIEGSGHNFGSGHNVTAVEFSSGVLKWDVMSGDIDLSSYETSWTGTRAAWDLLSSAEKAKYTIVNFTDDVASGQMIVTDAVTEGDYNCVTSNAVAKHIVVEEWTNTNTVTIPANGYTAIDTEIPSTKTGYSLVGVFCGISDLDGIATNYRLFVGKVRITFVNGYNAAQTIPVGGCMTKIIWIKN